MEIQHENMLKKMGKREFTAIYKRNNYYLVCLFNKTHFGSIHVQNSLRYLQIIDIPHELVRHDYVVYEY
jgi:hypothetical protein